MEFENDLFKMTQQEIREHIDSYNYWALLDVIQKSDVSETFLRELKDILGDEILNKIDLTEDFRREFK